MSLLGIDPSTKTGLAYLDGSEITTHVMKNSGLSGLKRLFWLRQTFRDFLDRHPVELAVIEGYAYGNMYTLTLLVEIGSVFRLELYERGIPCYIAPPTVVKKYATGKGNSKKPEMAKAASEKWGFMDPSDDVVDAYIMARIAADVRSGVIPKGIELLC